MGTAEAQMKRVVDTFNRYQVPAIRAANEVYNLAIIDVDVRGE